MRQAEYSPIRMGHYALASVDYCHFTSPIRRYPDLTIHRLIDALVRGRLDRPEGIDSVPTDEELVELGRLCGDNERRAESAGRELRLVLILRLLEEKFLGEEFIGVVTGVANFGVFVQIAPFLIDGLLKFDQLPEDWWEVAQSRASVIGAHSGQCITVGDSLKVRIARVHIPTRQLDLGLAQRLVGTKAVKARAATRKSKKGRSKPTKGRSTAGKSHGRKGPGSRKSRRG